MGKSHSNRKLFKELDKIYYHADEEGSYGGIQKLLTAAKAKGLKVSEMSNKDYLGRQASYSLHKRSRKNFKRNQIVVGELISNDKLIWLICRPSRGRIRGPSIY